MSSPVTCSSPVTSNSVHVIARRSSGTHLRFSRSLRQQVLSVLPVPIPARMNTFSAASVRLLPAEEAQLQEAVRIAGAFAPVLGSLSTFGYQQAQAMVHEAFVWYDELFTARHAAEWGNDFVIPNKVVHDTTSSLLAHGLSLESYVSELRSLTASGRFSWTRVLAVLGPEGASLLRDPQDFQRLRSLSEGMIITTHPDFCPLSEPPPLRTKYVDVHCAVDRLHYEQFLKGQVIFVDTHVARLIPGIHFSAQHWALKPGKPQGRAVSDLSNPDVDGQQTVNGTSESQKQWVREQAIAQWGAITLPSISDIVLMILDLVDVCQGDSSLVTLWQADLSGAYNLLDFSLSSIKTLAFALLNDITVIHTTGVFGLTGMPYAFEVISRVLEDVISARMSLYSRLRMYVDDGCGASLLAHAQADLQTAIDLMRQLLGDASVNTDKVKTGRILDMLGWCINLEDMTISPAHKNMLKAIYVFFCRDIDSGYSLKELQRLSSLATRYSMVCRQMRPYTQSLYTMTTAFRGMGPRATVRLSREAKTDIAMWRAFLCLLRFDERTYARSLYSFRSQPPRFLIEYDASLTGFGICLHEWSSLRQSYDLFAYSQLSVPYKHIGSDSTYQNACEYTAVLFALLLLQSFHVKPGFTFDLIGDSVSSLSWVARDKVRSGIAHNAHVGYTLVSVAMDATVADIRFIPSEANHICDGLSRGKSGHDLGLSPDMMVFVAPESPINQYISLCDPFHQVESAYEHVAFCRSLLTLLSLII